MLAKTNIDGYTIKSLSRSDMTTLVIISLFGVISFLFQCLQYTRYNVPYGDVGIIGQMTWIAGNFGSFFYNNNLPFYALDGAFALFFLSPIEHIVGIYSLFFVESLCISITAWYIFLYAKSKLSNRVSILLTMLFLFNPTVFSQASWGFDPLVITMCSFTIFLYYALEQKRFKYGSLWKNIFLYFILVFSLLSKNEASLVGIGLSLSMLSRKETRRLGIVTLLLSFVWFIFFEQFIITHLYHGSDPNAQNNWGYMGNSTIDKLKYIIHNPMLIFEAVVAHAKYIVVVVGLFIPFLFWSPFWILPILPIILGNVLSHFTQSTNPFDEYSFFIIPFLVFSVIDTIHDFVVSNLSIKKQYWIYSYIIFGLIFFFGYGVKSVYSGIDTVGINNGVSQLQAKALNNAFKMVPKNSLLMTTDQLGGHAFNFKYYEVSTNGISGISGSIKRFLLVNRLSKSYMYYICTVQNPGNPKISGWIMSNRNSEIVLNDQGVYLYKIPISSNTSFNSDIWLQQFKSISSAAQQFIKKESINNLYPLNLENVGFLPKLYGGYSRNLPNWNWTNFQGWVGPWGSGYAIGGDFTENEMGFLVKKYGMVATHIYYPYPNIYRSNDLNSLQKGKSFGLFVFRSLGSSHSSKS